GSIAIEWMRGADRAQAIAIERDEKRRGTITRNAAALGVPELRLVAGTAPAALAGLPAPDAIFIGGGSSAPGLVDTCLAALQPGSRIVANAVTPESEARLAALHKQHGGQLVRLAISRAEPGGWRDLKPITQWAWRR